MIFSSSYEKNRFISFLTVSSTNDIVITFGIVKQKLILIFNWLAFLIFPSQSVFS